jgi:SAM-dependent methyltransferase
MTRYENARLLLEPFLTPLHRRVRRMLVDLDSSKPGPLDLLDIGGRKSPYTIGLDATVTILDLPRLSDTQKTLGLGLDESLTRSIRSRRSNVKQVVLDDMTRSSLPTASFDAAVAVEVLEHVDEDGTFLDEVARVVRPGGWFFMTTPNGDYVPNVGNPDHRRHYRRDQLNALLEQRFVDVRVEYGIRSGLFHRLGLASWSLRHPIDTMACMAGNFVNNIESGGRGLSNRREGTEHLLAVAHVRPPDSGAAA